jgi:HD-like signal output (HDOD) protein/CheY-like chemotaxis protein
VKRILFVDDEPAVLEGLRNVLRSERKRWSASFALGGEEALAFLEAQTVDIVVTDMRMPKMDGLALLKQVRDRYPDVIRIVLTGYADLAVVTQTSAVAHQHLLKPCDFDQLRSVLERAAALQDLMTHEQIRRIVGGLGSLPSAPQSYQRLTSALGDPDVEVAELAAVVEQDVGMSSRVLQFVNSAYFGFSHRISSIESAVVCLGLNTLRHLALTFEVFETFRGGEERFTGAFRTIERHALLTARIARKLVTQHDQAEVAFAAGLLHDAGKLVLMTRMSAEYQEALALAERTQTPVHEAEKELIGANHAEVGAYLLGLWGLPHVIIEPVAFHHSWKDVERGPSVVSAICIADALAHEAMPPEKSPVLTASQWETIQGNRLLSNYRKIAAQEAKTLSE